MEESMKKSKISICTILFFYVAVFFPSCSSDVSSISDVATGNDIWLRKCTTKAQWEKGEICEQGYCKKETIKTCRAKDDCIYPEECVQGVCRQPADAGWEDAANTDVITDISSGGRIVAEPAMVDFGAMQFGEMKKKKLRIKNTGLS